MAISGMEDGNGNPIPVMAPMPMAPAPMPMAPVPGSQADFTPSAPLNARKGSDLATAEGYMAHQAQIIEQLQARLLEGAQLSLRHSLAGQVRDWAAAVQREFGPAQPAALPYAVVASRIFSGDEIIASVVGESDEERRATAEFIARACNAHGGLVAALTKAAKAARILQNENARGTTIFDLTAIDAALAAAEALK